LLKAKEDDQNKKKDPERIWKIWKNIFNWAEKIKAKEDDQNKKKDPERIW